MSCTIPNGYVADGCSGGLSKAWKFITGEFPPFHQCCCWHDYEYDVGGTEEDRYMADLDLFNCTHEYSPFWAHVMFWAVRLFGEFHFVWKWNQYEYEDKMP